MSSNLLRDTGLGIKKSFAEKWKAKLISKKTVQNEENHLTSNGRCGIIFTGQQYKMNFVHSQYVQNFHLTS